MLAFYAFSVGISSQNNICAVNDVERDFGIGSIYRSSFDLVLSWINADAKELLKRKENCLSKGYGHSPSVFMALATLPTPSIKAPVRMSLSSFSAIASTSSNALVILTSSLLLTF